MSATHEVVMVMLQNMDDKLDILLGETEELDVRVDSLETSRTYVTGFMSSIGGFYALILLGLSLSWSAIADHFHIH